MATGNPAASSPFSMGTAAPTPTAASTDSTASSHGIAKDRRPPPDGIINKTLFKCRKCKLLFWTTHEAASHEQACREPHWYNCSVCQVLRFPSREERAIHQRTCPGLMPLRIADLPLAERIASKGKSASRNSLAAGPAGAARRAIEKVGSGGAIGTSQGMSDRTAQQSNISGVQHKSAGDNEISLAKMKKELSKSSCNKVNIYSSGSCKEGEKSDCTPKSKDKMNYIEAKATVSTTGPNRNDAKKEMEWTTVWTCDICKQAQFDSFEAAVKHEKQCKGKKVGPLNPSLASASKRGPENATKAAIGAAALASTPTPAMNSLSQSSSSHSTKKPKGNKIVLFSPILKDSSDSSIKKRRGRPSGSKNASAKRQKATNTTEFTSKKKSGPSKHKEIKYGEMGCKFHIEEGTQFILGPLDGLPFLNSFSCEASKKLLPSEKFLLQQIELFTLYNVPARYVGLRCRNCIADKDGCCFMKLSSVDALATAVCTISIEHVMCCKFMKAKDVKLLQELKLGGCSSTLAKYCRYIAKLYSLVDSKNDSTSGVVWGESPKVPMGQYSNPMDINVGSFFEKLACEGQVESPLLNDIRKSSGDAMQALS